MRDISRDRTPPERHCHPELGNDTIVIGTAMNHAVILSAAKNHLERIGRRKMILRFAQDERSFEPSTFRGGPLDARRAPSGRTFQVRRAEHAMFGHFEPEHLR